MFDIQKNECPVQIHADSLDPIATEQIRQIAHHPALHGLISIMPDAHAGAGCVIGFTGKFRNAVIPNIVGVDIGCGVASHPLAGMRQIDFQGLDDFIREHIPLGMNQREDAAFFDNVPVPDTLRKAARSLCEHTEDGFYQGEKIGRHLPPLMQLGTLGGGNHFIEIGQSEHDGSYRLIVHSGSRNLGKRVAEHFQKLAASITAQMGMTVPKGMEYLPLAAGGERYMHWAAIAQAYARYNRRFMLATILEFFGLKFEEQQVIESVHNYIAETDHVIRKGAISAHKGEQVIIPLNMADGTIIGTGKGKSNYNESAPHGAGRRHSRKEMFRKLDKGEYRLEDFSDSMQGIFSTSINRDTFDESKFAYKDPAEIEKYLLETVMITDKLKPVYNLKAAGE
ncbi:MAG TPA: RtcB family protein [Deltaproteobacteria bacterium]|nr:RtcB family protein [Deltaproteobacteria bacterium]HQB39742.1 RtcB family protein [Deltaproteobacteria bacterium]